MEADLIVSRGTDTRRSLSDNGIFSQSPRLLLGTVKEPNAGLSSISSAIENCVPSIPGASLFGDRVIRIETNLDSVKINLSSGGEILARLVFLAAGVPGTAGILSRSMPLAKEARFSDHAPQMLLTCGLGRALGLQRIQQIDHFNSLSILREANERTILFGSVYELSKAPLSLLTLMMGIGPFGRNLKPPKMIDVFRPVQIWTPHTLSYLRYLPEKGLFEAVEAQGTDDVELQNMLDWLRDSRVSFRALKTPAGQGFHYHRLELSTGQGRPVAVDRVLSENFSGRVVCIDASVLPEICCMPHTLTAMAQAYARVRTSSGNYNG